MDITSIFFLFVALFVGIGASLITSSLVLRRLKNDNNGGPTPVRVDGDWRIAHGENVSDGEGLVKNWQLTARLQQAGHTIIGNASAIQTENSKPVDVIQYNVVGRISHHFVSLTFVNKDTARIACSIFLVENKGDGKTLQGFRCFYGSLDRALKTVDCVWQRIDGPHADCQSSFNTEAG